MKTKELHQALQKAYAKFIETRNFPVDDPHIESTIQRFEYTFELAWKLMSSILKDQSIESYGVKNVIRQSARLGIIEDVEKWFDFAYARNESLHIYKDEIAKEVYKVASGNFKEYIKKLLEKTLNYIDN